MVEPAAARGCCCRKPRAALMIPPSVTTLLLSFEGKLVKESRSWEEWTGQTLEQAGGLGWLDAHHPDDRKDTKTHLLLRSDPQGANNVLTRLWSRKHNSYRYMIARIDAKEQDTRVTYSDVTDLREAERKLAEALQHLRMLFSSGNAGAFQTQAVGGTLHLIFTGRASELLGVAPLEHLTLSELVERVHPGDREQLRNALCSVSADTPLDVHFRVLKNDTSPTRQVNLKADTICIEYATTPSTHEHLLCGIVLDESEPKRQAPPGGERASTAEQRATAAEQRAAAAEQRATAAEQRAAAAEQRAAAAGQRTTAAGERASAAEQRASDAGERATAAELRATDAGQRACDAELRASNAEQRATGAGQRATVAEQRASDAGQQAINAAERVAAAAERAATAGHQATAAEQRAAAAERRATDAGQRTTAVTGQQATAGARENADAEQRAADAGERATAAEQHATAAEKHSTTAEQRASAAEQRASAAGRQASAAERQATAAEQRASAAEQRAEHAEELRAQQQEFLDTICHEIRNPLQGVVGATSLLRDDLGKVTASAGAMPKSVAGMDFALQSAVHHLDMVDECSRQVNAIADDVLNLSRLSSGCVELCPQPFSLRRLFESLAAMFGAATELRKLRIDMQIPDLQLRADYGRLLQVIVNLLSNAVKFTPIGGTITLSVTLEEGALLRVVVRDTGVGMDREQLDRLFQRFSKGGAGTGIHGAGSGLGLFIAKRLVDAMQGSLELTSEKDLGTCAQLSVPVEVLVGAGSEPAPPLGQRTEVPSSAHDGQLTRALHVLVVDDNAVVRRVLEHLLQSIGCTYQAAANGAEAVEIFRKKELRFDAILMDMQMPVMNGIEATQRIRAIEQEERRQPARIIGLSGETSTARMKAAVSSGMDEYMTKPYKREDVLAALNCVGASAANNKQFFAP